MGNSTGTSSSMQEYFRQLEDGVDKAYKLARNARFLGLDPSLDVEIAIAKDLASRVESMVGPKGVADEIRTLFEKGFGRETTAFKICEKIVAGKFGQFSPSKAAEQAIRTGIAIITGSITSAPLEGVSDVVIRENPDGTKHLALYFSSPVRSAGGTAAALTTLLADYTRQLLHLSAFTPTHEEIERFVEEITLYGQTKHFQVLTSQQQIRKAAKNLPVELNGEPTEKEEVSGYRNIRNVNTNKVRGGMCLVLNDGVVGRAHKILKNVEKLGVQGWDWLRGLKKYSPSAMANVVESRIDQKKVRPKKLTERSATNQLVEPNPKFLTDILGGRPIFAHPTTKGGFRIRYGRSRNTGLAGVGIHPATMFILKNFLAPGTHIITERPGKGSIVTPVSTIQGPLVRLKNGSVLRVQDSNTAIKLKNQIERVIALGDILVSFGEFVENNHPLIPSGYVEEWWIQEVGASMRKRKLSRSLLGSQLHIPLFELESIFKNPLTIYPSADVSIKLCYFLEVPIHPHYTPEWVDISLNEFIDLYKWLTESSIINKESFSKISGQDSVKIRSILEKLEIPFQIEHNSLIIEEFAAILYSALRWDQFDPPFAFSELPGDINVLELINHISPLKFRWKSPVRTGARMGRPEKADERRMKPPVHILYPIGNQGGNSRNLAKAARKKGKLALQLVTMKCPTCEKVTHYPKCLSCGEQTVSLYRCREGHLSTEENCQCGLKAVSYSKRNINFAQEFYKATKVVGSSPELVKGVKFLMSKRRVPEPLEKGILRSKHNITVFKDGTCRFDMTDAPLTHFKPKEIEIPLEKLRALGYTVDIHGNPLVSGDQILELKVQDIIINISAMKFLERVSRFVDDELRFLYNQEPYYNSINYKDLIGHLVIGLAPHTSVGIIGRLIGVTRSNLSWAHPFWHAAKRRNCVSTSEEIPIWDTQKKQLLVLPISEIVEESINQGAKQEVVDDFGTSIVENLYSHWQVISIDPNTRKTIFQSIKHWIKGQDNQWVEIRTKKGRTIKMTANHHALVWNKEEDTLKKTKASLLKPDDYVPVATQLDLPIQNPPSRINILQELAENLPNIPKFQEFRKNVRLRNAETWMKEKFQEFAQKIVESKERITLRKSTRIIRNYFSSKLPSEPYKNPFNYNWYKSIPLSHLQVLHKKGVFSWEEIPSDSFLGMARDDHTICPYITFNSEFMRLLGYFISEGYIRDESTCYQTNFSVPNHSLRSHINSLIQQFLGSPPYYKEDNNQLVHTGRIHAYLFAYAWKIGTNALSKRIPSFIYTLPEEYRFNFLSALIDGDGTIIPRSYRITLYTGHEKLANDYCLLLSTLGVFARVHKGKGDRYGTKILERYKELGIKPKTGTFLYYVNIPGEENRSLLQNLLLQHNEKQNKFEIIKRKDPPSQKGLEVIGKDLIADKIKNISFLQENHPSYCLEVLTPTISTPETHNIFLSNLLIVGQCDGDEDSVILLTDAIINFSRHFLPEKRGGFMDAPLVLSIQLDPSEIDSEAFNIDTSWFYPLEFFLNTWKREHPKNLSFMENAEKRLGLESQYEGFAFTHGTHNISEGPSLSTYKKLDSMFEKVQAQLEIADLVAAVDADDVARRMLKSHFFRDIQGCLRAFGGQSFRCVKCNSSYRRLPLHGKCRTPSCDGRLILTVPSGTVSKYFNLVNHLIEVYELPEFQKNRVEILNLNQELLFEGKMKQSSLKQFWKS